MANDNIITINDLDEIPTAGENDYLLISSGNNTYRIKASAVGGSGGKVIGLTVDVANSSVTTNETTGEILALYQAGTPFTGLFNFEFEGNIVYGQAQFGIFFNMEGTYVLKAMFIFFEELLRIELTSQSLDSVMVANFGS